MQAALIEQLVEDVLSVEPVRLALRIQQTEDPAERLTLALRLCDALDAAAEGETVRFGTGEGAAG